MVVKFYSGLYEKQKQDIEISDPQSEMSKIIADTSYYWTKDSSVYQMMET